MKKTAWFMLLLLFSPLHLFASAQPAVSTPVLRYLSPSAGAQFVPPATTVALRLDGPLDPRTLSPTFFRVTGSFSGEHPGQTLLADDGTTLVFKPATPFAPGESVTVVVSRGLATRSGAVFDGLHSNFTISASQPKLSAVQALQAEGELQAPGDSASMPASPAAVAAHPQDYVTFPDDFPAYTVTVPASGTAPGLLFMAPFNAGSARNFLMIADDSGEPIYWQAASFFGMDFKRQPDGSLTYYDTVKFHVLDSTYRETKTIAAANGYTADFHDLQILPNGHALFMIYDPQIVNMKVITAAGWSTATVTGLVIQELDTTGLPVWQWDSWSHFAISDTYVSLTTKTIDYVHGNALELDNDGNILLSSRHLKEITKIDHVSGHIIWRFGGKNNQFAITDPDGPFSCQHDIRRLANGNITIFDNHNPGPCSPVGSSFSRAVEYQMDETAKVVTNTWQYRDSPDIFGNATGDNQRLPDGHRLIDWGIAHPNVTEVLTDETKSFEMTFGPAYFSYRAFRFPWAAVPAWSPTLVVVTNTVTPTLYYSWNGATDVAMYEIYGGVGQAPNVWLSTQPRTGFEDHTELASAPAGFCAFRVRPIDHEGQRQRFSNVVYTRSDCPALFLPAIFGP